MQFTILDSHRESYKTRPVRYTASFARTHLSLLIRKAEAGEEVVVTRNSKEIARIVPLAASESVKNDYTTPKPK